MVAFVNASRTSPATMLPTPIEQEVLVTVEFATTVGLAVALTKPIEAADIGCRCRRATRRSGRRPFASVVVEPPG